MCRSVKRSVFDMLKWRKQAFRGGYIMDGTQRKAIQPGLKVQIVLKKDQRTGKLTTGIVKDILTNSATHHRGIKVRLTDGQVGRVKHILG